MSKKRPKSFLGAGVGTAGVLGAVIIALRYAVRPPTKAPVPDAISSPRFARRAVHTGIGQVVYHECGNGLPLIFVHGICIGASSYEWSKVYPAFVNRFRVLAPDLIGFGESERPNANLGLEHYVRMLVEFMRSTCGEQRSILVGSGLGGGFCTYLASQHPELVSRIILLNPTGMNDFGKRRLPLSAKIVSRVPLLNRFFYLNYQSTRKAVEGWLVRFGFADATKLSNELVDVFTTCARQFGAQHSIRNFYADRLSFDIEGRLKLVAQPLNLLWGDKTQFPPVEWATRLQTARPCRLTVLKNTGALAALEDPEQVTTALEDLLDV
jgi:pimeloyl-ACP methyl ester carboxylesterase